MHDRCYSEEGGGWGERETDGGDTVREIPEREKQLSGRCGRKGRGGVSVREGCPVPQAEGGVVRRFTAQTSRRPAARKGEDETGAQVHLLAFGHRANNGAT